MHALLAVVLGLAAVAAVPEQAPAPAQPAGAECVPACRAAFVCVRGQCVSACNPACGAGELCTAAGECVPAALEPEPFPSPAPLPPPPPPPPAGEGQQPAAAEPDVAPTYDRSNYPTRQLDRPLTLPGGVVEPFGYLTTLTALNPVTSMSVGVAVGLGSRFELSLSTGLALLPGPARWGESLGVNASLLAVRRPRFELAPRLWFTPTFGSQGVRVSGFTVGPDMRLRLTERLALRGLESLLYLDPGRGFASTSIDVALEIQAGASVLLSVDTTLASGSLTGGNLTTLIDRHPLGVRALFGFGWRVDLSVGGFLSNLYDPSDGAWVQVGVLTRI